MGEADFGAVGHPPDLGASTDGRIGPITLRNGKEMPLRLRLIEYGADVVAGGRSSSGGNSGSGCMGEADFGAVGHPPGLRGLGRWVRWSHRLVCGTEMPLRLRLVEFGAGCYVREYSDVAYLAVCV